MTVKFLTWATGGLAVPFAQVWSTGEGADPRLGQVRFRGPRSHAAGGVQVWAWRSEGRCWAGPVRAACTPLGDRLELGGPVGVVSTSALRASLRPVV